MYYLLVVLLIIQFCKTEYFAASKSNIFSITENDKFYFGYSLQLQQSETNEFGRIIVGAPRASSTKNKDQNGATYFCSINTKKCEKFLLEQDESLSNNIGLGSAIDADENENGFIVSCAPRWSNRKNSSAKGMCFSFKNNVSNKLYPLQNKPLFENSFYYSQFGQVGFSAHLIKNEEHTLVLGSPGIYSWTGTLAQYSNLDKKENSTIASAYRTDKKTVTYSYFGYSISSGKFNVSNPNQIFYVAGAPRNHDLYGSVNVFDPITNDPFKNRYMFKGTQFGEYFGASIAVGDLDSDGLDDIIIGAPTYSNDDEEPDIGCIYVFRTVGNQDKLDFEKCLKITGEKKGAKFGFALSYLGDINKDGFGDIAVGAPYYNDNGAVYIYFGSINGLGTLYRQRILASDIDKSLRGFGYSLSRGLDVDSNTNNDLAVGAYISGQVVLLTSRPIVKIQTNMTLDEGSQLNINTTNLIIKYCLTYEADKRLPSNSINLAFSILNTQKATFENKEYKWAHVKNMEGHMESCDTFKILVDNTQLFGDILLQMKYEILSSSPKEKFKPLEENHSPTTLQIPFNKGCTTKYCKPNLKLTMSLKNMETNWVIGTSKNIELQIKLENIEDHSYANTLEIQVTPNHVKLKSLLTYCNSNNNFITCNFKYPIWSNEIKNIAFELDATKLYLNDTKIIINATIITAQDTDTTDNTKIIEIPLISDINFNILPKSQPEEINNLAENQTLNHQYNIQNLGVTHVKHLKLNVFVPYEIKQTKFLHFLNITGCSNDFTSEEFISTNNENNYVVFDYPTDNSLFVNCTSPDVKCRKIECEMMNSLNSFSINISMTINSKLIGELQTEGSIILSTTLEPDNKFISTYSHIWTKLVHKQQAASITKYLVIGICVSLLLVIILIFLLYKCGFFTKRKLPDKADHEKLLSGVLETKELEY